MKVREVLRLLYEDGWYLVAAGEVIVSSSIRRNLTGSRLPASPAMI